MASLPLTVIEWEEWGNPLQDPEVYAYMKSYSPYENVEAKEYPPLLATAGLTDPRVSYWEPAKWVARLRATKAGDSRLLLKTEMGAGHMGPSGRYDAWKDEAFVYAFVLPSLALLLAVSQQWFADLRPWLDFDHARNALIEGTLGTEQWAHLGVTGVIWLVVPLSVGLFGVVRAEVK